MFKAACLYVNNVRLYICSFEPYFTDYKVKKVIYEYRSYPISRNRHIAATLVQKFLYKAIL